MRSTIKLYRSEILPEKNMWIDSIQQYLAKKAYKTYEAINFMYIKIGLNIEIKIDASQENVGNQSLGNYCDIFEDNKHFYYFITNVEWTSKNAVRLVLSMDTINTFGEDFVFTDQTVIMRQHESRFNTDTIVSNSDGTKTFIRNIDHEPENIILPKILKDNKKFISNNGDFNWYLIYKTREDLTPTNTANPIECDLLADKALLIKKGTSNRPAVTFTNEQISAGKIYYMDYVNNPGGKWHGPDTTTEATLSENEIIAFWKKNDDEAYGRKLQYKKIDGYWTYIKTIPFLFKLPVTFTAFNSLGIASGSGEGDVLNGYDQIAGLTSRKIINAGKITDLSTIPFSSIDKTNSKLMKIIKLPYCPVRLYKNDAGEYIFPNNFIFEDGMMKLTTNHLSDEFEGYVDSDNIYNYLTLNIKPSKTDLKNIAYESKLYNSEFYTYKYVYDNFYKELKLENIKVNPAALNTKNIPIPINFKPTNTINSKFAFKFDKDSFFYNYTTESDYENYILVSRNNEETIFSNDYINYIRNGYNYDKKAKDMSLAQGILGINTGIAQTAVTVGAQRGLAGRQFDEDPTNKYVDLWGTRGAERAKFISSQTSPFLSAAAINAGFGAVNGLFNTIYGQISTRDSINAKLQQLSSQATNVSGSDDVDLLGYYNGNRLERKIYDVRELEKKNIYNLFFYTGYSHPVQDIPNIRTRCWFNYIKCTPEFKNEATSIYNDYLLDIKTRFENGVTNFHYNAGVGNEWDIEQEYENWENSVLWAIEQ